MAVRSVVITDVWRAVLDQMENSRFKYHAPSMDVFVTDEVIVGAVQFESIGGKKWRKERHTPVNEWLTGEHGQAAVITSMVGLIALAMIIVVWRENCNQALAYHDALWCFSSLEFRISINLC